jgi:serine-type D-Ala-D-Ala carboxypeptidase/endopeptidase (penicillin-binding protein 4)
MITKKKITLILPLLLLVTEACSTFRSDSSLVQNKIDSLLVSDFFYSTQAGISIYNLKENKSVYKHNDKLLLRPASNQKLLTTIAALKFLGVDHKFQTSVYHTGEIIDSICTGDLFVVGGFDPDFSVSDLDSISRSVKRFGISKLDGNLYGDVSAMDSSDWGDGWMWNDDPGSYAAYFSPLTVNDNCVEVFYQPDEVGRPAKINIFPNSSLIALNNFSSTIDTGKTDLNFTREWKNDKNNIIVKGTINKKNSPASEILSLRNPTFHFLQLMSQSLSKYQIEIKGKVDTLSLPGEAKKIFSFERDIKSIVTNTNKISDNLSAEMLLRVTAYIKLGKHASAEKGIIFLDSLITLTGKNPKQYMISDGSGMSYYNLLSAELIIELLKYMSADSIVFPVFMKSLPIGGVDGTLSNRFKNSPVKDNVYAKTGTLRGVSSLSGYVRTKKQNLVAFSVLIQNFVGTAQKARNFQEKICEVIFECL